MHTHTHTYVNKQTNKQTIHYNYTPPHLTFTTVSPGLRISSICWYTVSLSTSGSLSSSVLFGSWSVVSGWLASCLPLLLFVYLVCVCACVSSMYTCMYMCTHVETCVCIIHVHMHVHVYTCGNVCVCVEREREKAVR